MNITWHLAAKVGGSDLAEFAANFDAGLLAEFAAEFGR